MTLGDTPDALRRSFAEAARGDAAWTEPALTASHQRAGQRWIDVGAARRDNSHRAYQLVASAALERVADGAGVQQQARERSFFVRRQGQNAQRWVRRQNQLGGFCPTQMRQRNIHD